MKAKARESAVGQIAGMAERYPVQESAAPRKKREARKARFVVRMDEDEYRRFVRYCEDRHIPIGTAARSLLMDAIRRG